MFTFEGDDCWSPDAIAVYKWQDARAAHAPDGAHEGIARFGDGRHKTLYVAETPHGAMAEYFRRHPELLKYQGRGLKIVLYRIDLVVTGQVLDVRLNATALRVGIAPPRLVSSDADEATRYAECRDLAAAAVAHDLSGIAYPSAAACWSTWNLVVFGDPLPGTWYSRGYSSVPMPHVTLAQVHVLT